MIPTNVIALPMTLPAAPCKLTNSCHCESLQSRPAGGREMVEMRGKPGNAAGNITLIKIDRLVRYFALRSTPGF